MCCAAARTSFRLPRCLASHNPIIGKPRELIASLAHLPIKRRQENIAEQGRDHSALRGAPFARCVVPAFAAASLEHRLDQAQHTSVSHLSGHQSKQLVVLNRPEVVPQVRINNPLTATLDFPPHLSQSPVGRPPSPVSEAGIIEFRLEDRLQAIEQRLLTHPIEDRGHPQLAPLARLAGLRDWHLPYRLRPIDVVAQLAVQSVQLLVPLHLKVRHTLSVHTACALVGSHLLPGHLQILPLVDLVNQ